jgi:hypothetical protein
VPPFWVVLLAIPPDWITCAPVSTLAPLARPNTNWVPPLTIVVLAEPSTATTCDAVKIVAPLACP